MKTELALSMNRYVPPSFSIGYYPAEDVNQFLQLSQSLDYGLIDTLWIGDSALLWRECWSTIALGLAATHSLRFGTSVTNPLSRHWTVTASAVQTLNEFAEGRVRLGISTGDSALRRLNMGVARLQELRAAVEGIRSLLVDGRVAGDAEVSWDRPPARVPILMSGSGPKTLELSGAIGDGSIIVPGIVQSQVEEVLRAVDRGRQGAGRLEKVPSVLWTAFSVDEQGDQARKDVRPWVASVLRHPLSFEVSQAVASYQREIREKYDFSQHMAGSGSHADAVPDDVVNDFSVAGDFDEVRATLKRVMRLPVDEVAFVLMGKDPIRKAALLQDMLREAISAMGKVSS